MADDQFQYVKLPDGSYGKFPSSASDDQIRTVLASQFPKEFAAAKAAAPNYGEFATNLAARSAPKVPTPSALQGPPNRLRNIIDQVQGAQTEFGKDAGRVALGAAQLGGGMSNPMAASADLIRPMAETAMTSKNPIRDTVGQALGVDVAGVKNAAAQGNYPMLAEKTVAPIAAVLAGGGLLKDAPNPSDVPTKMLAAIKPTPKNVPRVVDAVRTAMPELHGISQAPPTDMAGLHGALKNVSLGYEANFQKILKPHENVPISTDPIADRVQSVIDKKPEQAQALQPLVDKYRGKTMTLGELNKRRPDVSGVEATGIRDALYGELQRLNPSEDVVGLKRSQSALMTLQEQAQKRANELLLKDAGVTAQPLKQRVINTAAGVHITRPATIGLQAYRFLNPKLASEVPNSQLGSAMSDLAGRGHPVVGSLVAALLRRDR